MTDTGQGWRSIQTPKKPKAQSSDAPRPTSAFMRLARVLVLSSAGDAMIAVALAGSLFFSIDPSAARWRVGLYLAFTVAPFAVVGPLIGPMLDRAKGGRRMMMVAVNTMRAVTALLMISNVDSLFLFPLAFASLVGGKSFAIGRAALVPTVVRDHAELVNANSRFSLISGLSGLAGAAPAALASLLFGAPGAVALAMVAFAGAAVMSLRLPSTKVAVLPADSTEKLELGGIGIRLASSAMGILRGIVGYLTFLVAFAFRGGTDNIDLSGAGTALGSAAFDRFSFGAGADSGVPPWQLGAVVAFNVLGMLAGALTAPKLRRSIPEENILMGALVLLAAVGLFGAWTGDLTAAAIVSFTVGLAASTGKLSFDSIVQRDAPDANYGRFFARFETRFQVYWVIGALLPVVLKTPAALGFLVIGIAAAVAAVTYFLGSRTTSSTRMNQPPTPFDDLDAELDEELRPSYPKMDLGSPKRMPTGWSKPASEAAGGPAPSRQAHEPAVTATTSDPELNRYAQSPTADPTTVDPDLTPVDLSEAPSGADPESEDQLPLWE